MNSRPYLIQQILDKESISDYLETQGYHTSRDNGSALMYLCPSPEHNDSAPSFSVYTIDGVEHFKCFGCGIRGDIINLYSIIEGCSLKAAIAYLGKGIEIDGNQEYNHICKELEKYKIGEVFKDIDEINLEISRMCYDYITSTQRNLEEIAFMDEVFKRIDICVAACDYDTLNQIYEFLSTDGLYGRYGRYRQRMEESYINDIKKKEQYV